ncbi:unnamed protein product [Medioppia subpectinata]|uniref:Uncharacterized protein n=1 Tax=Medioppia subpectinata TaxID=1979941 RepID=A0A7R9QAV8_9ACAR|nr:unnamed protein product [Medioppia subpectinata]CAG2117561.1 unnamed protein product [Medioppia subpectinata]
MSSVFIDRVPACPPNSSPENCQQLTIANEMFILRLMDTNTTQESTVIYKPNKRNQLDLLLPKDYPWNMTVTDFWPQEWDHMPLSERPAVYYAKTYEMMYIIKSGLIDAELLFNPISSVNWYKKFQRSKLNTTVRFIGMFTIDNRVIAVGIDPKDTTNEYRIYELNDNERQYAFKPSGHTLKKFLGCVANVPNPPPDTNTVTNTMATIGFSSSSVSPQLNRGPDSEGKTSSTTIVIVVTVILIVVIVLSAVIYFYIRRNANTETIAQRKKMSEKESKATDTETRLMSIETINSSTGFKDK